MTYQIIKHIHGLKYYWNNKQKNWQGLISNGTPVEETEVKRIIEQDKKKSNENVFYSTKTNKDENLNKRKPCISLN